MQKVLGFFRQFSGSRSNWRTNLLSGIVIAAMTIPISMGYAQIAGLPPAYGLYGSVLPVLVFGLCSSSRQFIFGVDAAPAAMIGALLPTMGVAAGTAEAQALVPVLTFYTALWLGLFALLRAGKLVDYISAPVMGGFISGICCEIILMQVPKLMGGSAASGEVFHLLQAIIHTASQMNGLSLVLGLAALVILLAGKKLCPRFPMAIVIMLAGVLLELTLHVSRQGVALLSAVPQGLGALQLPDFSAVSVRHGIGATFPVAIVIMAETLLAEQTFAQRRDDTIRENREVATFALSNLTASFCGCCPINGSVSRSTMNAQLGGNSQLVSIIAAVLIGLLLLFATGFIAYLPVPVVTAIVISALMSAVEVHLAKRLWVVNKKEFMIFLGAFAGVLLLGTIYGVVIGVVLSGVDVFLRAAQPRRSFLGVIEGRIGFYSLDRMDSVQPVPQTVIYQFSGPLFFANVRLLREEILAAIGEDTRVVVLDASAVGSVDFTAAEQLVQLWRTLQKRQIHFYMAEHIGEVNDELRRYGAECLIAEGVVRRTIASALLDAGIKGIRQLPPALTRGETIRQLHEFEWAYGDDAAAQREAYVKKILARLQAAEPEKRQEMLARLLHQPHLAALDSDDMLLHLKSHVAELAGLTGISEAGILRLLEQERTHLLEQIGQLHPEMLQYVQQHEQKTQRELEQVCQPKHNS